MPTSAPSDLACAAFSAPRPVVMTFAPAALAIWIAVTPMPDVAPCTKRVSPAFSMPISNTFAQTVKTVSGRDAASAKLRDPGTGRA